MDLWRTIKADHTRILEICHKILGRPKGGMDNRDQLFGRLDRELGRYMRAEANVLYPVLESDERTRADALWVARQQGEIGGMFGRLAGCIDKNSPEWTQLFTRFVHALEHHFSLLEHGVLVTARGTLSPQDAEALTQDFERGSLHVLRAGRPRHPAVITRRSWPFSTALLFAGGVAGIAALVFATAPRRRGR